MVAAAVDPTRQPHGAADIGLAKLAASMGAIGVHGNPLKSWGEIFGNGGVFGGLWGVGQGRTADADAKAILRVFPVIKAG
jgi:hypothetical protein